jgi:hypothetical protein
MKPIDGITFNDKWKRKCSCHEMEKKISEQNEGAGQATKGRIEKSERK